MKTKKQFYVVCDDDRKRIVCTGKLPHMVKMEARLYLESFGRDTDLSVLVYESVDDFANFSPKHKYVKYQEFAQAS